MKINEPWPATVARLLTPVTMGIDMTYDPSEEFNRWFEEQKRMSPAAPWNEFSARLAWHASNTNAARALRLAGRSDEAMILLGMKDCGPPAVCESVSGAS